MYSSSQLNLSIYKEDPEKRHFGQFANNENIHSLKASKGEEKSECDTVIIGLESKPEGDPAQYQCLICHKLVSELQDVHLIGSSYFCQHCYQQLDTKLDTMVKATSIGNRVHITYTCQECFWEFDDRKQLKHHYVNRHPTVIVQGSKHEVLDFKQTSCSVSKESSTDLDSGSNSSRTVQDLDSQMYSCSECGKSIQSKNLLPEKLKCNSKIHLQKKRHSCNECGKSFWTKTRLSWHRNTHKNAKTYECEFCGLVLNHRACLITHLKSHKDKQYQCNVCKVTFHTREQRIGHCCLVIKP